MYLLSPVGSLSAPPGAACVNFQHKTNLLDVIPECRLALRGELSRERYDMRRTTGCWYTRPSDLFTYG